MHARRKARPRVQGETVGRYEKALKVGSFPSERCVRAGD
jgi:hypothetical protein